MSASAVDRVRTIPLIVEKGIPMAVDDEDNSGFPFDREFDRDRGDDSFRSQLDDIAKRHPEFAEHLEGFPFRADSLGRRSRPPRPSDESEFRRFGGRPFGSGRFERYGFPFRGDPFEDEFDRPEEQRPQQSEPQHHQQETSQQQPEEKKERGRRQNIQPSNTVDLGQKQEPVNDRNQRSMSAPPPDNRSGQQRYVSSINIPINRDGGIGESKPQPQAQPQQQEKPANKPTERVIPIHVEGRDEPVMPKHAGPSFGQTPQPERVFSPSPQPERIFGHRPERFTQFVGREPPRQFTTGPEWHHPSYAKQETPPAEAMRQQQQQKFQQQQQPQEQVPPPQQQQPQQQQPPQPQQQPKSSNNPIDIIQSIQKDVSELMSQVEKFSGVPRDKQYLYLDEMLTRNLIKLDNIDTQGQENIRQARKEAIKCIEKCIGVLEAKAAANVPKEQSQETKEESMEVENKCEEPQQPQSEATAEEKTSEAQPVSEEKMEVEVNKEGENISEAKVAENTEAEMKEKTEEKVENKEEQPASEEKMEVVAESAEKAEVAAEAAAPVDPQPKVEEKPNESSQSEKVEEKPADAEMTSTQDGEPVGEEDKKDESGEDKKDKKKGKKKVVKK